MELILLGTGVPRPTTHKYGPANAIVSGEKLYLVDAARNVTTQILKAGFPLKEVDHLLFTHFHSDHYTGFGEFFLSRWMMLAKTPLRVYGPPPVHGELLIWPISMGSSFREAQAPGKYWFNGPRTGFF